MTAVNSATRTFQRQEEVVARQPFSAHKCVSEFENARVREALFLIDKYGLIDGAHHKQWLIDQIAITLMGRINYGEWIKSFEGTDYKWDVGIAP